MKLNTFKQQKKEFDPMGHWYRMVLAICVIFVVIIGYGIYSFFFIKKEIALIDQEARNNVQNSTTTKVLEKSRNNTKLLKDIGSLNAKLEEFDQKEAEYERLMKTPVIAPVASSSISIATSTE